MLRSLPLAILVLAGLGCSALPMRSLSLPGRYTLVREPLVVYSDFPFDAHHRLLDELVARRADASRALGLPSSSERAHVYLFESTDRFKRFLRIHHPEMPARRAFFLETDTRLLVYAQWGDRVAEDLRHELTHAYLHAVVPNLPLWLDEGLAEYFESPRGYGGLNRENLGSLVARMEQGTWSPDLERLERLAPTADMTHDDYAESWAWAHWLLHGGFGGEELLRVFLADLRDDGLAEPISQRLKAVAPYANGSPSANEALVRHVRQLALLPQASDSSVSGGPPGS
ncbi:MAG: DUF1570 domain-containing protein [Patescibacteria group bacterium]|nr:DUF1570 domain-containing protein [Patescibacteria group bacterium]